MKKLIWTVVILAVVALFGGRAWWLYQHKETDANVIKIGAILPLSAFDPDLIQRNLIGIRQAEADINDSGILENKKIKILVEDGKHEAKSTASAFHKLLAQDVKAFLIFGDAPTYYVKSLIDENKLPIINIFSSDTSLIKKSPYIFGAGISNEQSVAKMVDFIAQNPNLKKIAVIKIKNNYGEDNLRALKEALSRKNADIVAVESVKYEDLEARPVVEKILAQHPDAVIVWSFGPSQISAFKRLKEARYEGYVLSDFTFDNESVYGSLPSNGEGVYYTMVDYNLARAPKLVKKMQDNGVKANLSTVLGYAVVEIMADAIRRGGTKSAEIRQALLHINNFDTVLGPVSYSPDGQMLLNRLVIKQMLPNGTKKVITE